MSILIHEEIPVSVVTVSGEWSDNTVNINGLLQQILIKPASNSTMYDFSLTNDRGDIIYNRTDVTGTLNEENNIPFHGIYTMKIENATADESFNVLLSVRER